MGILGRNYDPAISQGGQWLLSDTQGGGFSIFNNTWYVSSSLGNDNNSGSQASPYATIAKAASVASANDTIIVGPGTYADAIVGNLSGLRILGAGTSVKSVVWKTGVADSTNLKANATNIEVAGIYFQPPVYSADATCAAIQLSNAGYLNVHDCRFQGQTTSYNAIYSAVETSDNVSIVNNDFEYMNTASHGAAILTLASGGLSYSDWKIIGNKFSSCVSNLVLAGARVAGIYANHFGSAGITSAGVEGAVTTTQINLSGTSSGANQVHGNYLGGTYSSVGGYTVGAAGDDWSGNFNIAGITTANPT